MGLLSPAWRSGRSTRPAPGSQSSRICAAGTLLGALLLAPGALLAGHELSYYPSFYPSDITLKTMDPAAAGTALKDDKLHAYVGATPTFAGGVPPQLHEVDSLGGYVVLSFNPGSARLKTPQQRCRAAVQIAAGLSGGSPPFVVHPYPITPFDADYLEHADRAAQAKQAVSKAAYDRSLKVRVTGALGKFLAQAGWPAADSGWDAELSEVPLEDLMSATINRVDGTVGPPWIKEGWFRAWRLLGDAADGGAQNKARGLYERLSHGDTQDLVGRYNLERELVQELERPCTRVVVGHTVRREYYNDSYSFGVENVGWDSGQGLNSPVFIRTVKLKDYPWNGPLFLGVPTRFGAAWNPIAGFGDPAGRLVWSIIADDAFMMLPYNASWIPNRIDAASSVLANDPKGYEVPAEAVLPELGTGVLRPVGPGKRSSVKILYRVLSSPYQDGTEMEMADALYPYIFAFRWGGKPGSDLDPAVKAATALVRERVVGIRPLATERTEFLVSDIKVPRTTHIVELYLNDGAVDPRQMAALAPPWSAVPWHVMALMEESVSRGMAAFSQQEAARRAVPWLDLVRDPALLGKLRGLAKELEKEKFRPAPLAGKAIDPPVTDEGVARRWAALRAFDAEHGHFLVTDGPYRLKQWSADSVKFEVLRDFKYAVGIGTFDGFADPAVARVTKMHRQGDRVLVDAELEMLVRYGRDLKIIRAPLRKGVAKGFRPILPRALAVLIGPAGAVVAASRPQWQEDGRFSVSLPKSLPKGAYRLLTTVYADDNAVKADVGMLQLNISGP